MLLSSVILVLREILEAALIISILLALSRQLSLSGRWIGVALLVGVSGAALYASTIGTVSTWFDDAGQEVANATMQLTIFALVGAFIALLAVRRRHWTGTSLVAIMIGILTLSVTREGAEIFIYYSGFLQSPDLLAPVLTGGGLGTGIGLSIGALFYYALVRLQPGLRIRLGLALLALLGANMVSQAVQLLTQVDWLDAGPIVWDSRHLLAEESVAGQLLYALVGYEATPSRLQVMCYLFALLVLLGLQIPVWLQRRRSTLPTEAIAR